MRTEAYLLPKPRRPPGGPGHDPDQPASPASPIVQRIALVVEDEWLVRAEIADALTAAGWTVIETASGEEAIETLTKEADIGLLVTDIRLIGAVDGWDVAEAFRAAKPEGPVIYASANPTLAPRPVPGSVFVEKPTRMSDLLSASEALWRAAAKH